MPDKLDNAGSSSLDDMVFDEEIASREGVSLDYMARVRIAFLLGQNQSMITQTQFADAKAGALLAFIGLVATRGPGSVVDLSAVTPMIFLQVAFHGVALVAAIVVLYPRYANLNARRAMAREDRYSWPSLTTEEMTRDVYSDFARRAELSQLVVSIARSNHSLSRILLQKFTWLRVAFTVAAADVGLMALRAAVGGAL